MEMIHPTAIIGENVTIGKNTIVMPYAVIGMDGFYKGSDGKSGKGTIEIGDNNIIGAHVCIMASENGVTKIGDNNKIMNFVNIGHDTVIGSKCIISAGTTIAGFVTVKDYVNIGIGSTIKNRVKIKRGCMIGMGSVVTKDTGSWAVYQGNPARQMRFNQLGADRSGLKDCHKAFIND